MFMVVGPNTVVWFVGAINVEVKAVALTPASLIVYEFIA
jgi:hypothetical protein